MSLTIRARLTLLYFGVLTGALLIFVLLCDYGFQRSINTTVNEASLNNLESVRRVIDSSIGQGLPVVRERLTELSNVWANSAIFEVAGPNGEWLFRSPRFLSMQFPLPTPSNTETAFVTNNLDWSQFRIARQRVSVGGQIFLIDAAVPTEPFDQALDRFRRIEKEFIPLLILVSSLLGYWLSGRALAPVASIIQTAEGIGVQNLSQRLEVPRAKDELRRLTETVNDMLARIESSVKRMNQFTADASHDLRTPLALIRTNAELALRRSRSETEYRETLARILTSSEETTELIEKLLMLARADAGASQLTYQVIELGVTVLQASRKAEVLALSKGVVFFENVSTTPMFVKADRGAIETLLLSLLDNAVKYTAAGGEVFLRSRQENGSALIEVEDTGIGIADIDLPKIFDRFFRADQARSREIRGSGLGLSIAQWIAEIHNGTIEVKSELGHGSLFTVRLPLTIAPATNQVAEETNQPSTVAPH